MYVQIKIMTLIQVPGNFNPGTQLAYRGIHSKNHLMPVEVAVGHKFAEWQKLA